MMLPAHLSKVGFYTLHLREKPGEHLYSTVLKSAILVLPKDQDRLLDSFFTVSGFRNKPFMCDALSRIGVGTVMLNVSWKLESKPGQFGFNQLDKDIAYCHDRQMKVIAMQEVHAIEDRPWSTPKWEVNRLELTSGKGYGRYDDQHFRAYENFVRAAVKHFQGRVDAWYLMQEVDIPMRQIWGDPMAYYIRRVRSFASAARQVMPKVKIYGVGVAPPDTKAGFPAARAIWPKVYDCFDAFWPHVYPSPRLLGRGRTVENPETFLPKHLYEALEIVKPYSINEVGISEWGYCILDGVDAVHSDDALRMAQLTARGIILMRSVSQLKHFAYFTVFQTQGDTQGRGGYGLWDVLGGGSYNTYASLTASSKLTPRPTLGAYATIANLLAFITSSTMLNLPGDLHGILFQTQKQTVLPLWSTNRQTTLQFELPCEVQVHDMMGGKIKTLQPGKQSLSISQSPVYLLTPLEHAHDLAQAISHAHNDLPFAHFAMRLKNSKQVQIDITNQQNQSHELEIQLACGNQTPIQKRGTLAENSSQQLSFDLPTAWLDQILKQGMPSQIQLDSKGQTPLIQNGFLHASPIVRRQSPPDIDGHLRDHQHLPKIAIRGMNFLFPPDAKAGKLWRDDEDASLDCWLSWDQQALYMAFEIHDDVLIQENPPMYFWKQDHLAIAIDTGNDAFPNSHPDGNDIEISLSIDPATGKLQAYCNRPARSTNMTRGLIPLQAAMVKRTDGWDLELALPWQTIMTTPPVAGQVLPLSFTYGDADVKGQPKSYWMQLTSGIHDGKRPFEFRPFILQ